MRQPDLARNIIQSRAGGRVERCHGVPHAGSYSNAAHSWGVAMLMWYLWPEDFPRLSIHCLTHDVPEAWVGDVPAPVSRYVPSYKAQMTALERRISHDLDLPSEHDLGPEDYAKLKACDVLEFWLWCRDQMAMGNLNALEPKREVERYFEERPLPDRAAQLYAELREISILPRQAGVIMEMMNEQG